MIPLLRLLLLIVFLISPVAAAEQEQHAAKQPESQELFESAMAKARMAAEIAKADEEFNKRPWKRYFGVRVEEYRFARYLQEWTASVERLGTLNYPVEARGKLYGTAIVTVEIAADGTIRRVEINRSSGHKVLDDYIRRVVMMGSPYTPFPPEIRRDTDIIGVTRPWHFERGNIEKAQDGLPTQQ